LFYIIFDGEKGTHVSSSAGNEIQVVVSVPEANGTDGGCDFEAGFLEEQKGHVVIFLRALVFWVGQHLNWLKFAF